MHATLHGLTHRWVGGGGGGGGGGSAAAAASAAADDDGEALVSATTTTAEVSCSVSGDGLLSIAEEAGETGVGGLPPGVVADAASRGRWLLSPGVLEEAASRGRWLLLLLMLQVSPMPTPRPTLPGGAAAGITRGKAPVLQSCLCSHASLNTPSYTRRA
jgi:hypothetical protein